MADTIKETEVIYGDSTVVIAMIIVVEVGQTEAGALPVVL